MATRMDTTNTRTILFVDTDLNLFQTCFGKEEEWNNCKLVCAPDQCSANHLASLCSETPNLVAVVFMDDEELNQGYWEVLKQYYHDGGFLVFFAIMGEFAAPKRITTDLGFDESWCFSGYTKYDFVLTSKAIETLGDTITTQEYTKSNLIRVPEKDRWMVPKVPSMDEYITDYVGIDLPENDDVKLDEDDMEELQNARDKYPKFCEDLYNQCPLAVHTNETTGGKFAYLGFVNGDNNIPTFVRGLILSETTASVSSSS